jgi:AraC family transcriptional regulator of adaptative response / DNA-3-methyladenine glycosylase II
MLDMLEREELLTRFYQRDTRHDGQFVVGVVTTGIYCLPSCPARKPRAKNVLFFEDEGGARQAGLRACKRCRPDHFYRGYDPDRECLSGLVQRLRRRPSEYADTSALAEATGFGATKLNQLFRCHYHTTPAAFLARAKLAAAAGDLARSKKRVLDVAFAAGFESSSAFHENFKRSYGMAPLAYRKLGEGDTFSLALPAGFRREDVFGLFSRDAEGLTERADGRNAGKALMLGGRPCWLAFVFSPRSVRVTVHARRRPSRGAMVEAHDRVRRMLGLGTDPGPFERRIRRMRGHSRLVRGRAGLRIPLTPDAFEGLVWVIVGQQVNLTFASTCRNRLIELAGEPAGDGFITHPAAEAVAQLDYGDLEKCQYSRRKAEYVIDTSRLIARGSLDLEGLAAEPATTIEETLGAIRGLGPWSVQYLLMRSYGLEDCVPVGDAALVAALQKYFDLEQRPGPEETLRVMEPFAPHRSLATFHLWQSLGEQA